jgi:hypothetical protein
MFWKCDLFQRPRRDSPAFKRGDYATKESPLEEILNNRPTTDIRRQTINMCPLGNVYINDAKIDCNSSAFSIEDIMTNQH